MKRVYEVVLSEYGYSKSLKHLGSNSSALAYAEEVAVEAAFQFEAGAWGDGPKHVVSEFLDFLDDGTQAVKSFGVFKVGRRGRMNLVRWYSVVPRELS